MSRACLRTLSAFVVVTVLSIGCTKRGASTGTSDRSSGAAGSKERVVSLATWVNYVSPEIQEKFTRETGIRVQVSTYSSNEELLAKLQAGAAGIDVAVPSDYMVGVMTKLGLLHELDGSKIPNRAGLDPNFLKQDYDPENKFSLPYTWMTAGIAINRDLYKAPVKSWKDLFANPELAGKFSLLDDARETLGAALKANGFSVNTTNPAELEKAKATLKEARSRIKMFRSDTVDLMVNKEVAVAHSYSLDALQAAKKMNGKIEYVLPEDGGTRSIDNLVIVKGSKHADEAHALINFMLNEEANAILVQSAMAGPVVKAVKAKLPENMRSNPSLFPSEDKLKKFERIRDVGEATRLYDRIWTEIKSE